MAPACAGREWYIRMFYTYLIRSKTKNWVYVGLTKDVESRIESHNKMQVRSTKSFAPFDLVFVQVSESQIEARDFEKFLKVRWNKESLLELLISAGGGMVYAHV